MKTDGGEEFSGILTGLHGQNNDFVETQPDKE